MWIDLASTAAVKGRPDVEIVTVSVSNRDKLAEELPARSDNVNRVR